MGGLRNVPALALIAYLGLGCDDGFEEPGPTTDCFAPTLDELPFDRDSIEPLVDGRHESTLAWVGPGSAELADERIVLDVRKTGDLRWGLHCGGYVRFDVDVDVELPRGRRATFGGQVFGSKDGAQLFGRAPLSAAEQLGAPEPLVVGRGSRSYWLSGWIDEHGVRGSLASSSDTAAECERARWPADRVCTELDAHDVPFETKFGQFRFADVESGFEQLQHQELVWSDGSTTTLEVSIEPGGAPVCVGRDRGDDIIPAYRGQTLSTTFRAHVRTSDGRVDAHLPLTAAVQWSPRTGLVTVPPQLDDIPHTSSLIGDGAIARAAEPNTFDTVAIYVALGRDGVRGTLFLGELTLDESQPQIASSGALERMSLDGVCLEGASTRQDLDQGGFGVGAAPKR
ncbi:MAG TPA: hypothetical protein VJR89_07485 [Polyangiales bacterium]|nr:hypothetical protein [Polyangiales bacterium]